MALCVTPVASPLKEPEKATERAALASLAEVISPLAGEVSVLYADRGARLREQKAAPKVTDEVLKPFT